VQRAIAGFHQDQEDHWVAELECGHTRHVRHNPPWQNRPWVVTQEGRTRFLGTMLDCAICDEAIRPDAAADEEQNSDAEFRRGGHGRF
jgi:Protein of unknown function (DUF3565)